MPRGEVDNHLLFLRNIEDGFGKCLFTFKLEWILFLDDLILLNVLAVFSTFKHYGIQLKGVDLKAPCQFFSRSAVPHGINTFNLDFTGMIGVFLQNVHNLFVKHLTRIKKGGNNQRLVKPFQYVLRFG